jgi:hypothetical protein
VNESINEKIINKYLKNKNITKINKWKDTGIKIKI